MEESAAIVCVCVCFWELSTAPCISADRLSNSEGGREYGQRNRDGGLQQATNSGPRREGQFRRGGGWRGAPVRAPPDWPSGTLLLACALPELL